MNNALIKLDQATKLLTEVRTIQDAKSIIAIAEAAKVYAKQAKLGSQAILYASQVKMKAQRLLGEMLKNSSKNKGGRPKISGYTSEPVKNTEPQLSDLEDNSEPTLADLGLTKRESVEAQILAEMDPETFNELLSGNKTISEIRKDVQKELKKKRHDAIRKMALSDNSNDRIKVFCDDFVSACSRMKEDSVDLILTDPPYPKEFLSQWDDLGKMASKVLKPGGFLVTYSGQLYLPDIMRMLGDNLEYYWLAALHHQGTQAQRFERHIQNAIKPILIYCKPPMKKQNKWLVDLVNSPKASKEFHDWGQSVEPVKLLIETFSQPDDLVLDPFGGGGTTALACKELLRKCIIIEKEKEKADLIKGRLQQ